MVMKQTLQSSQSGQAHTQTSKMNGMKDSLLLIKRFVLQFVTLIIIWMIFHLTGSTMYQEIYKRSWGDDEIVSFMLLFDIGFLFCIAAALSLVKYVHDVSTKRNDSESARQARNNTHVVSNTNGSSGAIVPTKRADDFKV